jgi:hypothetical protein
MGKRKATEINNLRLKYVSLVDEGANGKKFQIFKSADYKPDKIDEEIESVELKMSDTEVGVLKKITNFFVKNNEEVDMDEVNEKFDKVSEMIKSLGKKIEDINNKFDKLSEGDGDVKQPEEKEVDKTAGTGEGEQAGKDTGAGEGTGTEPGEDFKKEITSQLDSINERLDKIEASRVASNASTDDGNGTGKTEKSVFDGFFGIGGK